MSGAETVDAGAPRQTLVQRFRLRVLEGPDQGASQLSSAARLVVGTHESADLRLGDRTVSRFHCEIAIVEGAATIRDLDSTNGTEVDGVRVLQAWLKPGARITLGQTKLVFELDAEPVSIALSPREKFGLLVGRSPAMRSVFALLERAAASDATVLLEGETGTGKEIATDSIHRESTRAAGPLIVVDCGAIPRELLESELFGHEKGAFTGAVAAREGAFAAATGGTIFLDEIGDLPQDLQPKLLRVLEKREVKPVGANLYKPIDVRVVAATNRDLRAEVNARRFRSDLYYRLAVIEVRLPPLRDRREDLGLLVDNILEQIGVDAQAAAQLKTPEFLQELERHSWPGNVRELRNYLERCHALRDAARLAPAERASETELRVDSTRPLKSERDRWVRLLERQYLEEVLRREGGNVSAAARAAGIDRIHFYRLLWRHGLK